MKVLIVEDEKPAARRLQKLLLEIQPAVQILNVTDSLSSTKAFLAQDKKIDLIFLDIHLADGLSLQLFKEIDLEVPVIFTTAYDEYAIEAFRFNSIDYLLKPIEPHDLQKALEKWKRLPQNNELTKIAKVFEHYSAFSAKEIKTRFLIKEGEKLKYIKVEDVACISSSNGFTLLTSNVGKEFVVNESMEDLYTKIDRARFFRISRQCIINIEFIEEILPYSNNRLEVVLKGKDSRWVVSRERVSELKRWLENN